MEYEQNKSKNHNQNQNRNTLKVPVKKQTLYYNELQYIHGEGYYKTREGKKVQIYELREPYWVGVIFEGNNKRNWQWFKDGKTYGQEIKDDLVKDRNNNHRR